MATKATWKPHTEHGKLDTAGRKALPDEVFAFPQRRKLPLIDASHVQNALARFDQVDGVSDDEREVAFANIERAAKHYDIAIAEERWQQLGRRPHTRNSAQ